MKKILIVYKSVTGFTERYAQWIAEELHCETLRLKAATAQRLSEADIIVFGSRFHAGRVDGLAAAKALFEKSTAKELVVFATGATPTAAEDLIREAWSCNFTEEEAEKIPRFYLQSGLNYERMPFRDKLMMKVFSAVVKRQKDDGYGGAMKKAIAGSFDYTDRSQCGPLTAYLKERQAGL